MASGMPCPLIFSDPNRAIRPIRRLPITGITFTIGPEATCAISLDPKDTCGLVPMDGLAAAAIAGHARTLVRCLIPAVPAVASAGRMTRPGTSSKFLTRSLSVSFQDAGLNGARHG